MWFTPYDYHDIINIIIAIVIGDLGVQGVEAMIVRTWRKRRAAAMPVPTSPQHEAPLSSWEVWLRVAPEERSDADPEHHPAVRYRLEAHGVAGAVNEAMHTWSTQHPDRPILGVLSARPITKDQK